MTAQENMRKNGQDPVVERDQLREALATMPVIEQAKGMIRLLCSCTSEEAFTALRTVSQNSNVKLHDVANVIVAAGSNTSHALDDETVSAVLAETRRSVLGHGFALKPG
ncbi:ANTAR domain-containing protein [Amycolatopsis coloradensis]|uniref:ANTAR domain-containing protein n=1 Tax=Amycolatopsis coloradensis TaxID=76021 RepID=UPI001FC9CB2D|nr:ANTAR domain-containing protein [Amycolatopsis coloradensis]